MVASAVEVLDRLDVEVNVVLNVDSALEIAKEYLDLDLDDIETHCIMFWNFHTCDIMDK